jgi:hypothetical protein
VYRSFSAGSAMKIPPFEIPVIFVLKSSIRETRAKIKGGYRVKTAIFFGGSA